jgi:GDP-L-fucose synthase
VNTNDIESIRQIPILVTGGSGFVGQNLLHRLRELDCKYVASPSSEELNLLEQRTVFEYFDNYQPHLVIHLAGKVGGIAINRDRLGEFFYENALMGILVYEASRLVGAKKLIALAAGCGYPEGKEPPYKESHFFDGLPDTNSYGYSLAKKNLVIQGWAYRDQYNFDSTVLLPANLYGPFDNFDLYSSHVVPALIRKFSNAVIQKESEIQLWGTGKATREFLFVDDIVDAIIHAISIPEVGPFNVGTGHETSIHSLANTLATISNYKGELVWDNTMPDGQTRRVYDMTTLKDTFGWMPTTSLYEGLKQTYEWYTQRNGSDKNG